MKRDLEELEESDDMDETYYLFDMDDTEQKDISYSLMNIAFGIKGLQNLFYLLSAHKEFKGTEADHVLEFLADSLGYMAKDAYKAYLFACNLDFQVHALLEKDEGRSIIEDHFPIFMYQLPKK